MQLHLRLEGDLGREFGTAAGEVEVGLSGEVLIDFDSAEEADAWFYDFADRERGLRASATVDASFLGATPDESVGGARAEVAGELVLGDGNEFQSLTLSAEVGGSVPLDSLGFDLPGGVGGQAASVEFSIDRDNPYAPRSRRRSPAGTSGGPPRWPPSTGRSW